MKGMLRAKKRKGLVRNGKTRQLELTLRSLKKAQAQLVQSEKMASLGTLAAGVAHEINNPMSFIMSNVHVLRSYVEIFKQGALAFDRLREVCASESQVAEIRKHATDILPANLQEELNFIFRDVDKLISQTEEGAVRVRDIVRNLKEFAHANEAKCKWVDINDGLNSTLQIAMNELKYKAEVSLQLGSLPLVYCNSQEMNQVFLNLMTNAAQAIPKKGLISIRSFLRQDVVVLEFEDTGVGISKSHLKRVFDPFFTTKPIGKGTGLGLSIAHEIVERHYGRLEVESELGKGSIFRVLLPTQLVGGEA